MAATDRPPLNPDERDTAVPTQSKKTQFKTDIPVWVLRVGSTFQNQNGLGYPVNIQWDLKPNPTALVAVRIAPPYRDGNTLF
jgi:hypothetical protein